MDFGMCNLSNGWSGPAYNHLDRKQHGKLEDSVDIKPGGIYLRGIFQGDSLSPLLFVITMIPLSLILRDPIVGYQLKKEGCKINHLLFMDDLKLYGKNSSQIDFLVRTVWSYETEGMLFAA